MKVEEKNGDFDIHSSYYVLRGSSLSSFLGKVFGGLKSLGKCPFLFEQWHGGRYLPETIWGEKVYLLWISVVCAGVVGRGPSFDSSCEGLLVVVFCR